MKLKTTFLFLLFAIGVQSQITDTIKISFTKTAYLIFENEVTVDYGSEQIATRTDKNTITVQAQEQEFDETNMMVESGGKYFMFIVQYDENPNKFIYNYQKQDVKSIASNKFESKQELEEKETKKDLNDKYIKNCKKVMKLGQEYHDIASCKGKMTILVSNISVVDDKFYIKLNLINRSKMVYDIDYYTFIIRKKKKFIKKSAEQDIMVTPVFVYNKKQKILSGKGSSVIYVIDKYSINSMNKYVIEFYEKTGERNISINIEDKDLTRISKLKTN